MHGNAMTILTPDGQEQIIVKEDTCDQGSFYSRYTIRDTYENKCTPITLCWDDPRMLRTSKNVLGKDVLPYLQEWPENYNDMCDDLQRCLRNRSSARIRDMTKHKKLNDANDIFNRMV